MRSFKFLLSIAVTAMVTGGSLAVAGPSVPMGDGVVSAADQSAEARKAYATTAEVALLYAGGKIFKSVNVADVTNPAVGIYCVKPSVKLDLKKTFPQVTVERSLSVGFAFWGYWVSTEYMLNPLCSKGYIEIETDTLDGANVVGSNSVAFDLFIQ